jgi:hypothetical protein
MDILAIPFHKFLHFEKHPGEIYLFEAKERPEYLNHLQTIHACVQLALAEASSGEFLLQEFQEHKDNVIPVIRKTEAKYHRPAKGSLYSKAGLLSPKKAEVLDALSHKRRTIVQIKVEIYNEEKLKVMSAVFDWFLAWAYRLA